MEGIKSDMLLHAGVIARGMTCNLTSFASYLLMINLTTRRCTRVRARI